MAGGGSCERWTRAFRLMRYLPGEKWISTTPTAVMGQDYRKLDRLMDPG